MADDLVDLYRGYTENRKASGRMPANALLARNIKRLRDQHGMSQDNLAAGSGFNKTWLNRVERGQENASVTQLDQLARALRVETAELFKQEDAQAAQAKRHSRK
jgi:transcriptional regulator with XRE-family HTH domain